jgi:aminoglycoside phosphotransferase family enzyme/predicted kinase
VELDALMEALRDASLYPGGGPVEVRQTHISAVFLTPGDAYKLKKPVDFGFVDYSTLRKRAIYCRREVELNRRLAPDVYLGVERLTEAPGRGLRIGGSGRTVDYLVHMRRLADGDTLAARLTDGRAGAAEVAEVARVIARAHAAAPGAPKAFARGGALRAVVEENFRQAAALAPRATSARQFAEILERTRGLLAAARPKLAERAAAGRVRECHGDLRCEHVYIEGAAQAISVIDCIEFNQRFRCIDVASDLAFLVMDLATSGYPDFANVLLDAYVAASGDDVRPLMPVTCAYRAFVRGKVALLRAGERELGEEARAAALLDARKAFFQALRSARGEWRPLLVLTGGLTGTGKSTLARALAPALGATIVSADETRKRLAGLGPFTHASAGPDTGIYAPEMNARVYAALAEAAREALARGRSIVLDATFRRAGDREAMRTVAAAAGAQFLAVGCTAPDEVVRARLEARAAGRGDAWSDGTWAVYLAQREELTTADAAGGLLPVDTTQPLDAQVGEVLEALLYPGTP